MDGKTGDNHRAIYTLNRREFLRLTIVVGAAGAASGILGACATTGSPPSTQKSASEPAAKAEVKSLTPINARLALGIDPVYTAFYVAEAEGLYKSNGVDAVVAQLAGGGLMIDAVNAGQQDITMSSEQTTLPRMKGDLLVVATAVYAPKTLKIVANAEIKNAQDLKGKTVGTVSKSVMDYVWGLYLEKNGMKLEDVKFQHLDPPDTPAALDRGFISAFCLFEPWPIRALEIMGQKAHILATSDQLGYGVTQNVLVAKGYAEKNPQGVERTLKALIDANDFMKKDPKRAAQITAEKMKVSEELAAKLNAENDYSIVFNDRTVDNFSMSSEWMKSRGVINEIPDWKSALKPEFLKRVAPGAVTTTKL